MTGQSFPTFYRTKHAEVLRQSQMFPSTLPLPSIPHVLNVIDSLVMPLKYSLQKAFSDSNDTDFHQLIFNQAKY